MGSVRDMLRRATDDQHRALEAQVDAIARFSSEPERTRLTDGYRRLELVNGAALAPFRAHFEAAGLPLRGGVGPLADGASPEPKPTTAPEALGYLYVVCGSALGGTVILRTLGERGCDTSGLGFLVDGPYAAPALWRSLLVVIERDLVAERQQIEAVAGARMAFATAGDHLGRAA